MIVNLYAVKDTKACFNKPIVQLNEATAVREFSHYINSGDPFPTRSYGDLELWHLGTFDDVTGTIVPCCDFVVNGASVKEVTE